MAWNFCDQKYIPPAEYDYEPTSKYQVFQFPAEWIVEICGAPGRPTLGGCTAEVSPGTWWIRIRDNLSPTELACVLRHEKGHVNGWVHGPSNWPLARSRDAMQRIIETYRPAEMAD
jgi:hypothetical protein